MKYLKRITIIAPLLFAFLASPIAFGSDLSSTNVEQRIVGGTTAKVGKYPWMVALINNAAPSAREGQFCGGTLIAENWVLTAAHCLTGKTAGSIDVLIGNNDLLANKGERITASELISHPDYSEENFSSDIALIKLSSRSFARTLNIFTDTIGNLTEPDTFAISIGWGLTTEFGSFLAQTPALLQQVSLPIITAEQCSKVYAGEVAINDTHICAGYEYGQFGSCQGDSGGPLLVLDETKSFFYVAGVTSFGIGCARPGVPGVYARVSEFAEWIMEETFLNVFAGPVQQSDDVAVVVGAPSDQTRIQGIVATKGFATAPFGIKRVELYIDGGYFSNVPFGSWRPDVAKKYPNNPGANFSGFSIRFPFTWLADGAHKLTIRAIDKINQYNDSTINFVVNNFGIPFQSSGASINLDAALFSTDGDIITIDNFVIAGQTFSIDLGWDRATQGYKINRVVQVVGKSTDGLAKSLELSEKSSVILPVEPPKEPKPPSNDPKIVMALGNDLINNKVQGIKTLSGFATALVGIGRIELALDGIFYSNIPVGGETPNVLSLYPDNVAAANSGFSINYPFTFLSEGPHELLIRTYDNFGRFEDAKFTINANNFDLPFIADGSSIDLENAVFSTDAEVIKIDNIVISGVAFNIDLGWDKTIQGYSIVNIEQVSVN